ncbi:hypothetical protein LOY35_12315 [Pseudomonas sp. B21-028]|jgi:hypothetical protein|uniref:hypothetical protein n=1 Tax=Pseudomonas sp. B21-028 TaxID=2895480 RepID=UPI00215FEE4E|nr:hypothetical protein [Pseudomonas sp. B21-028]UVL86312.1 hypothetical protein LOY35_12315 [Pseudomonas sp. B21-028]
MSLPKTQRSYVIPTGTRLGCASFHGDGQGGIKGVVMSVTPKSGLALYGAKP